MTLAARASGAGRPALDGSSCAELATAPAALAARALAAAAPPSTSAAAPAAPWSRGRSFASAAPGGAAAAAGAAEAAGGREEADDAEQEEEEDLHAAVLDKALDHVTALGWTADALRAAAADLGLSPAVAGAFPRGPVELVERFAARCDAELEARLAAMGPELAAMRTTARVAAVARARLEMLAPVADTWAQALALQAAPAELAATAARYGRSADIIWRAAGDRSTDMNWYSKRGLLIGAYVATELHMLTDCSPGFADSWTFLDRRLADAMALGRAAGQAASAVGGAGGLAGFAAALGDMLRPPPRPL